MDHTFADLDKVAKYFVGFDKFNEKMMSLTTETMKTVAAYPPFNVKKTGDNTYMIELAVAGFGKQDIEVVLEDGKLVIKGNTQPDTDAMSQYIHKGIADRAFTRTFTLADNIEIKNAHMFNGLLKIWLEHIIPDEKKPKKIPVTDMEETKSTAELLTEKTK